MMGSLLKEDLSEAFDSIVDPRINRTKKFPLNEILFLPIVGAFCGIESWRGIELLGEEKLDFLRNYFPFKHGIPTHQTISRVISLLKPQSFEKYFMDSMAILNAPNSGQQIAIDGKTVRGSADNAAGKKAIHLLNAIAVENGIVLGQLEVGAKTNEITTVPEMLNALDIKGAMISVDALNTQKAIAEQIIDAGASYTMALKGNHKNLNQKAEILFAEANQTNTITKNSVEKKNGRVTERTFNILPIDKSFIPEINDWKGLESLGLVTTNTWNNGKESHENRYYLLSYFDIDLFAKSARGHWAVESMHWVLDVTFGEDASKKRKDHVARNYSLIRKLALNVIRTIKGKLSVTLAHIKATINEDFLSSMVECAGFKKSQA